MQLIDRFKEEISKRGLSVLKVSNETGISAYKIYKWFDGKAKPKHEDTLKVEEWLRKKVNGSVAENGHAKETSDAVVINDTRNLIKTLQEHNVLLKEIILSNLSSLDASLTEMAESIKKNQELLTTVLNGITARGETVLEALDKLAKEQPGTHAGRSDIREKGLKRNQNKDNQNALNKGDK